MEVWLIQDGEKVGPFHDFEIRRKITLGELSGTTSAWHEGCGPWKPLNEIEIFRREFDNVAAPGPEEVSEMEATAEGKNGDLAPAKSQLALIRRFCARWLDLSLYSGMWWLGMWAAGQDIESAITSPSWIMLFHFVPWFALESVLLSKYSTTPGKFLLGIRVFNSDGTRLDLAAATRRSMNVLFIGIGFGWLYLMFFCHILAVIVAKRIGATLWDHSGGHQVTTVPLHFSKVMGAVSAFIVAIMLHLLVLFPYAAEDAAKTNPKLREHFEKHPAWGLPRRK